MTPQEKAKELVDKYSKVTIEYSYVVESGEGIGEDVYDSKQISENEAKECALIAVEMEYNSLREQLFNLRACGVIENENVYLKRIDLLNIKEAEVKAEIEKL